MLLQTLTFDRITTCRSDCCSIHSHEDDFRRPLRDFRRPTMKARLLRLFAFLACVSTFAAAAPSPDAPALSPKANDLWVMAGDSITAQRMHTNYIEAFFRTRYPELNMQFRNSGIGGNTTGSILNRFDYDVAAWKPTIVSIELGMNDVGGGDDPAKY